MRWDGDGWRINRGGFPKRPGGLLAACGLRAGV